MKLFNVEDIIWVNYSQSIINIITIFKTKKIKRTGKYLMSRKEIFVFQI